MLKKAKETMRNALIEGDEDIQNAAESHYKSVKAKFDKNSREMNSSVDI